MQIDAGLFAAGAVDTTSKNPAVWSFGWLDGIKQKRRSN
jgi:hypothetical protein